MILTITIPDIQDQGIVDSFCDIKGYQEKINNEKNPQTKKDFTIEQIEKYIKSVYALYAMKTNIEAAKQVIVNDADEYTKDITVKL